MRRRAAASAIRSARSSTGSASVLSAEAGCRRTFVQRSMLCQCSNGAPCRGSKPVVPITLKPLRPARRGFSPCTGCRSDEAVAGVFGRLLPGSAAQHFCRPRCRCRCEACTGAGAIFSGLYPRRHRQCARASRGGGVDRVGRSRAAGRGAGGTEAGPYAAPGPGPPRGVARARPFHGAGGDLFRRWRTPSPGGPRRRPP